MRLRLVVPHDVDEPTGGNAYDVALAEAMSRNGEEVELVRAGPSTLASVLASSWRGQTLVDGLVACSAPDVIETAGAAVLVHMPLALQDGLTTDRAAQVARLERRALKAATSVVATSTWTASYLTRRYWLPDVSVALPGVESAVVSEGSDPPLLVHVAALLPHKNQLAVVNALSQLTDLAWRARLVGSMDRDPGYAATVREAVSASGLADRVEMPGVLPRESAWAGADLTLLPSRVEAYGMVVTEALARGIPAVVSDTGAVEALGAAPDGRRPGAVIPIDDPDALASVLRHWLTDQAYRGDLRALALARRRTLDDWSVTADRVRAALSPPSEG